jgi:hypothetical protein
LIKNVTAIAAGTAAIVLAAGGYSLGAVTASKATTDTICASARNVPVRVYAKSARCPAGDHAVRWTITPPTPPQPAPAPVVVEGSPTSSDPATAIAQCPKGDYAVGGGFSDSAAASPGAMPVFVSEPVNGDTAWQVMADGSQGAYAVCEAVTP